MSDNKENINQKEEKPDVLSKKQGKKFLSVYIVGLFGFAIILIMLSYLTQMRANETISETNTALAGSENKMMQLQEQLANQQTKIDELTAEVDALIDVKVQLATANDTIEKLNLELSVSTEAEEHLEAELESMRNFFLAEKYYRYGEYDKLDTLFELINEGYLTTEMQSELKIIKDNIEDSEENNNDWY